VIGVLASLRVVEPALAGSDSDAAATGMAAAVDSTGNATAIAAGKSATGSDCGSETVNMPVDTCTLSNTSDVGGAAAGRITVAAAKVGGDARNVATAVVC
jgi:hypothetical protein